MVGSSSARLLTIAVVLLLPVLLPPAVRAQGGSTASILGVVTDSEAAPVSDATVTLHLEATGARRSAVTDAAGRFRFTNLQPGGPYTLFVERLGAASVRREGIHLAIGETLRLELILQERPVELDGLEVAVAAPGQVPAGVGAATVLDATTVMQLPSVDRDVRDLAALSPFARLDADGSISIAGQNNRYNGIRVNGAALQDHLGLSATGVPGGEAGARPIPLSAIEQFQVVVAPYDVRLSGFTGGLMNAVTRTGTNEWRAEVFGHFRDHRLMGELSVDDAPVPTREFGRTHAGVTLGGPIRADRAHVFLAYETEQSRTPVGGHHIGASDPFRIQVHPDSADRLGRILRDVHGADAGTAGPLSLSSPRHNFFTRFDVRPNATHRLVAQYAFIDAARELAPNREPFDEYEFSSTGTRVTSGTHAATLQWFAEPGGRLSSEVQLNIQRTRSRNEALSDLPLIEVDVVSEFGDGTLRRRIRTGAEYFAHLDEAEQSAYQLSTDLKLAAGDHSFVVGAAVERVAVAHRLLPGSRGRYVFDNLPALEEGHASYYERTLLLPGQADATAEVSLTQVAGYVQHEWYAGGGLTLHSGVRLDVPMLGDRPEANPLVREAFGVGTDDVPLRHLLASPRFGFNWRPDFDPNTQLRGGIGIFTGRPPLVWLANAYGNTGLRFARLRCVGSYAPEVRLNDPPATCADGRWLEHTAPPTVVILDSGLRFPQELRGSIALDRQLPLGLAATVEAVYTRATRQIEVREINLTAPIEDPPLRGYGPGLGDRDFFGFPTIDGFAVRRADPRFGPVIRLENATGNYSYALTAELRRSFGTSIGARLAYAYSRSGDRQSLVSTDAAANVGLTPGGPGELPLRPSVFDQPHKVTASTLVRLPTTLAGGTVTLSYVGQSGRPYSYVYLGDANGDGYPGDGRALDGHNDLIYVPLHMVDVVMSPASTRLLEAMIASDPCLERFRGMVLPRNHCRLPWSHRLDLRIAQPVSVGGMSVEWVADVANLLNLINGDWGRARQIAPVVPLLDIGRQAAGLDGLSPDDPILIRYAGPTRRDPSTGSIAAGTPWTPAIPESQWQIQLGLRVAF